MAGEYDKQFKQLTQLIKETAERGDARIDALEQRGDARIGALEQRSDARFDALTERIDVLGERTDSRFEEITQIVNRTSGRLDELTLEVRDLRKTLLATNEKIDVLHTEVTGNLIFESKRITSLESRVDILEQKPH